MPVQITLLLHLCKKPRAALATLSPDNIKMQVVKNGYAGDMLKNL